MEEGGTWSRLYDGAGWHGKSRESAVQWGFQTRSCISRFLECFVVKSPECIVRMWNWCVHMAGDASTVFSAFEVTGKVYLATKNASSMSVQMKWAMRNIFVMYFLQKISLRSILGIITGGGRVMALWSC